MKRSFLASAAAFVVVGTAVLAAPASATAAPSFDPGMETKDLNDLRAKAGRLRVVDNDHCTLLGTVSSPEGASGVAADPAQRALVLAPEAGRVTAGRVATIDGQAVYAADVLECDLVVQAPTGLWQAISIPGVEGATWTVNGEKLEPNQGRLWDAYGSPGTYALVAHSNDPDVPITGQSTWTFEFTGKEPEPHMVWGGQRPELRDAPGAQDDAVILLDHEGYQYSIDGQEVPPGTYPVTGARDSDGNISVRVTMSAAEGYQFRWPEVPEARDLRFTSGTEPADLPLLVGYDNVDGPDDTFTIPAVKGVEYIVDGAPREPGTYRFPHYDPNRQVTVTVGMRAAPGYYMTSPEVTQFWYSDARFEAERSPGVVFVDKDGRTNDTFTIPETRGLTYQFEQGGTRHPIEPGTYNSWDYHHIFGTPGYEHPRVTIYAEPVYGYKFNSWYGSIAPAWSRELTDITPPVPAKPRPPEYVDEPGVAADGIEIPSVEGVVYSFWDPEEQRWRPIGPGFYLVSTLDVTDAYPKLSIRAAPAPGYGPFHEVSGLPEDLTWHFVANSTTVTPRPSPPTTAPPELKHGFFLNDAWSSKANHVFQYGRATDAAFVGDWNGDGKDTVALRRGNVFLVNDGHDSTAERTFVYGRPTDVILVGDWNGDGIDTLAVRRGNAYHVKNTTTGGPADQVIIYGRSSDEVHVGDWDGDGRDTFAVRRGRDYHVKNTISGGKADQVVSYGRPQDVTLAGDWDGDGKDTFAVRRANTYYIANAIRGGNADQILVYGRANDHVLVGDWNADSKDTLGVRRLP